MFNQIYENCIAQIEVERKREVETARQKVMQEQIVPHNRDIDNSLRDALAELKAKHDEQISAIQKAFEEERIKLTEAANAEKQGFAEVAVQTATDSINKRADAAVAKIRDLISEQEA